ncbi:hypothetical protein CVH10_22810, partial [Halomonas sp. ND22Bw]|uniref:hypothetical protein n=1 Tax=Halomonas sp. ND22Bw TaxID=2054178 RepID=UPI000D26BDE2
RVHCKGATKAILGRDRVEAVLLEDGTVYGADLVCMAVGIRPEVRIATDAAFAPARARLARQCGAALAHIHATPPPAGLETIDAA